MVTFNRGYPFKYFEKSITRHEARVSRVRKIANLRTVERTLETTPHVVEHKRIFGTTDLVSSDRKAEPNVTEPPPFEHGNEWSDAARRRFGESA